MHWVAVVVWALGWGPLKKDLLVFVGGCVSASLPVCVPVEPRRRQHIPWSWSDRQI